MQCSICVGLRGLDNSGKTTIVLKINGEDTSVISPTLGFNIKTIKYDKYVLLLPLPLFEPRLAPMYLHSDRILCFALVTYFRPEYQMKSLSSCTKCKR